MKIIIIFAVIIVIGCAQNTGIVKIADDTYMHGKFGGMIYSGSIVKAELYNEAIEFCKSQGKKFVPISSTHHDSSFDQYAAAEIHFMCK